MRLIASCTTVTNKKRKIDKIIHIMAQNTVEEGILSEILNIRNFRDFLGCSFWVLTPVENIKYTLEYERNGKGYYLIKE